MARSARKKSDFSIFHIIVKSISDVLLFKSNDDKNFYLSLIKHYQYIYKFKVYSYCLMSNHAHFIIDVNGADISKIMHCINFRYALYFNKKYKRKGPLFLDRFKSKIVHNEQYLINLSAYIHKNPLSISKYRNCIEKYTYSSLCVFLGFKKDKFEILDEDFIMQLFSSDVKKARKQYLKLVFIIDENTLNNQNIENEKASYNSNRNIISRSFDPEHILEFISDVVKKKENLFKNNCKNKNDIALTILLMRCLCDFTYAKICKVINISEYKACKLCDNAVNLLKLNPNFKNIIEDFISIYIPLAQ